MAAAKTIEACERALLKLADAESAQDDATGEASVSVTVRRHTFINGTSRWSSEEWTAFVTTYDGVKISTIVAVSAAKLIAKCKTAIEDERAERKRRLRIEHRPKRLEYHG